MSVALVLVLAALVAGYLIFPKGVPPLATEEVDEAARVDADER